MTSFVERAPRVPLRPLHQMNCKLPSLEEEPQATNISVSGIGFLKSSFRDSPRVDALYDLELTLGNASFALKLKIAHASGGLVGAAFVDPPADTIQAIRKYFDAELEALEFVKVDPSLMKKDNGATPVWYQGLNNSGLYFVLEDGKKIKNFSLDFFGNRVEGGLQVPLRFGQQVNVPNANRLGFEDSTTLKWDAEWPAEMLTLARRVLHAVPELENDYLMDIEAYLQQIPVKK